MRVVGMTAIFLITASLTACQDGNVILPGFGDVAPKSLVVTVPQGTIVSPEDTIPLSLSSDIDASQKPDSITMQLLDSSPQNFGAVLFATSFGQAQLAGQSLPAVKLPAVKDGSYQLVFDLYRQGSLTKREETTFFVCQAKPVLRGIAVHPISLIPGGDGILELLADVPDGKDAYVRWYFGTTLLKVGMLSQGLRTIAIVAPSSEGVYTYRAELFPQAPLAGTDYSFASVLSAENRVVVSSKYTAGPSELGPPAAFSHLFHFQGTLQDSISPYQSESAISATGQRLFDYQGGRTGYRIGPLSGLVYSRALHTDWDGLFPAELIRLRLVPISLDSGKILQSANADRSSGFELLLNDKKALAVHVWGNSFDRVVQSPAFLSRLTPADIQLGFGRSQNSIQVLLIVDGVVAASETVPYPATGPDASDFSGSTNFAGMASGTTFLIDEFGAYRGKADLFDAYRLSMEYRYGKALRLAHDFSLDSLSADTVVNGKVTFENSALVLSPGESSAFSVPRHELSPLFFEMNRVSDGKEPLSSISVLCPGFSPIVLGFDGVALQGARSHWIPGLQNQNIQFSLEPNARSWSLVCDGVRFAVQMDPSSPITIRIDHKPGAISLLGIARILGFEAIQDTSAFDP